jgi:DNA-binding SARP family transcriptional activator
VAVSERSPSESARLLGEAVELARRINSAALTAALSSVVQGAAHAAMLEPFVAGLRRRKPAVPALSIEYATGVVRCRGRSVDLRPRERRLLMIVSCSNEPVAMERLSRTLWPEADDHAARNALKTTLHRLRRGLGDAGLLATTARGIGLRDRPHTDLQQIANALRLAESSGSLSDEALQHVRKWLEHLRRERPSDLLSWDWYESLERQMVEWARVLAVRLATEALARQSYAEALALARQAAAADPYDERPQEIAISALAALGDQASALRTYRDYRETLRTELDVEPPAQLEMLTRGLSQI